MNTIEHYEKEKKIVNQVVESEAMERQERTKIVNAYLKGQEAGDMSRDQIFEHYFHKYKDFILDDKTVQKMKPSEKLELLKELIYKHEILHEEAENMGVKKAA